MTFKLSKIMIEKQFRVMGDEERKAYIVRFQKWVAVVLPSINNATTKTEKFTTEFEEGLELMSAFAYCRNFISESMRFKTYLRDRKQMMRYVEKIKQDIKTIVGNDAFVDLSNPDLLKPHVGRPTDAERQARQLHAERMRREEEDKQQTLFGAKSEIPIETPPAPNTVSGSQTTPTLHLNQLTWLMSDTLRSDVERIRELRATAASASERAKQMAEDGVEEALIAEQTQAAASCTEAYEAIYEAVDKEMAKAYVRMKYDKTFIAELEQRGIVASEWRTTLRPYWDKVENQEEFKAEVIKEIDANDPAQAEQRRIENERKARIAAILKYLKRTDKPNTPKRIEGMKAKFKELEDLIGKDAAAEYTPIIDAAVVDCEMNVKPLILEKVETKLTKTK